MTSTVSLATDSPFPSPCPGPCPSGRAWARPSRQYPISDIDAYLRASSELVGWSTAVGNVSVGGILAEVRRLALPPMPVEIAVTAMR